MSMHLHTFRRESAVAVWQIMLEMRSTVHGPVSQSVGRTASPWTVALFGTPRQPQEGPSASIRAKPGTPWHVPSFVSLLAVFGRLWLQWC